MIDWKDKDKHSPTDGMDIKDWMYDIEVFVYPDVEGNDNPSKATYMIRSERYMMTQSDGYQSYEQDVTDMITHFCLYTEPEV